jgi:hypothetical protein
MIVCQYSNHQEMVGLAGFARLRWLVREPVRHGLL